MTALLAFCLGLWYLAWRVTSTLNTQDSIALGISVTLYLAEVYGFIAFVLFYLQSRQGPYRKAMILKDYPSVDVFVTIYNESLDVLQRTLVCCRSMDYPQGKKKIYVLDDGNRPEVRKLSEKLGCFYLNRSTLDFAKAGNLNHGLAHSSGELVVIFDCDHIPVRSFLKETVGFFDDPKIAIVQTPHYFYNPDTFQRNLRLEQKLANEQDLFFRVIEPGRDHYNAAFFAGSSGIFRRSALKEVGDIQTLTLTEDLHTSMVLHSRGYKSVYVPKVLAAGLAPESFESYLKQRKRWTRGGIQVFLLDNPLWKPGLSFSQRIQYFSALYYFFHGIPRLIYLSAPLAYLLFGYAPLTASLGALALHFIPYYVVSLIAFQQVGGRARNSFWSDVYETAMCFSITTTAFSTLLSPWRTNFQVTPKGVKRVAKRFNICLVLPHLGLSVLLLVGTVIGVYHLVTGHSSDATAISLFWATYNLFLLSAAISVARERKQIRSAPRLPRMVPGEIRTATGSMEAGERIPCVTSDLSETGASLIVVRPCSLPTV
ncbi:MAG: glycosyltransferase, partial [Nitrospirae bacterium]|nr:glycosyltransferase [Nitrospirota bacterium]